MELHPCKSLISLAHTRFRANQSKILGINLRCPPPPSPPPPPLITSSKKSSYQDFQEYAKPSRLLPAGGVRLPIEKATTYKLRLQTSNAYGSGLTDVNSGILLCLIDENGSSILQRLSGANDDLLRFERGAIDEFAFEGPCLGRIVAVWISLESGQWRISGINLRVGENTEEMKQLQYSFKLDDILLGEKGEASMVELRPYSVTSFSGEEDENLPTPDPISIEESMKEYAYLKQSLLFYDVVLVLVGSAVASVSIGGNAAYAFLIGGSLGFAYLLLVQRSVDELPTPDVIGDGGRAFGGLKGSVLTAAAAAAAALVFVVRVRLGGGEEDGIIIKFEAKDVIFGMMGFVMCKVAVVLAAFKPMTPNE